MSEFDKEAEREKLRKRFEEEQERQESTEHMSELLLKGATMTNRHCGDCGNPIFRYEGQEFCPTCQQQAGDGENASDESANAESDQVGRAQDDDVSSAADEEADTAPTETGEPHSPAAGSPDEGAIQPTEPTTPEPARSPNAGPPATHSGGRHSGDTGGEAPAASDSNPAAALEATIQWAAQQATQCEDPRQAKEYAATAREAAEALAALSGSQ